MELRKNQKNKSYSREPSPARETTQKKNIEITPGKRISARLKKEKKLAIFLSPLEKEDERNQSLIKLIIAF